MILLVNNTGGFGRFRKFNYQRFLFMFTFYAISWCSLDYFRGKPLSATRFLEMSFTFIVFYIADHYITKWYRQWRLNRQ